MSRKADQGGRQESLHDGPIPHISPKPSAVASKAFPWREREWNTRSLFWRLTSDITAAGCASGLVAPLISAIDRAIIENASGRSSLRASLLSSLETILTRPHLFVAARPFLLVYLLYFGTYAMANTVDTISSTIHNKCPEATTAGPTKFIATSTVNMSLCLYKDSQFTKMFGPQVAHTFPRRPVPITSYALFAMRDSMTIFASFNLPPLIAPMLPLSESVDKQLSRASVAQFLAPAGIQLLSTPLHLWGLDLYNRPGMSWNQRLGKVGRDWLGSSFARMCRIVPAFGVGGVVNGRLREKLMSK